MSSSSDPASNQWPVQATGVVSPNAETPAVLVAEDGKVEVGSILLDRFTVMRKLGRGTFGYVYEVYNEADRTTFAVKIAEKMGVAREEYMYKILQSEGKMPGIPYMYHNDETTYQGINKSLLLLDHLGPSLKELQQEFGGQLSLKTVMMTGIQLLDRLEGIHDKGILHRDLKPANILIGSQDLSIIHLVDFGLAIKYHDSEGAHSEHAWAMKNYGTVLFMSKNSGSLRTQSRRDDLESLGYVLVYLLTGTLPWDIDVSDGMHHWSNTYTYVERVQSKKEHTSTRTLLKGLGIELADYFKLVSRTGFEQRPDYNALRSIFNSVLIAKNFSNDGEFEWNTTTQSISLGGGSSSDRSRSPTI